MGNDVVYDRYVSYGSCFVVSACIDTVPDVFGFALLRHGRLRDGFNMLVGLLLLVAFVFWIGTSIGLVYVALTGTTRLIRAA